MNYLICEMKKAPHLRISALTKDIMWNGSEVSDNLMNTCHEKLVTWLCVNPNKISTTRRKIKNEQCEQQAQIKFNYNFESLML